MGVSSSNRPQIQKMGTLQKFKLLATQYGVAQSPTRSPGTSPFIRFRRRKPTLLMLLTRSSSRRRDPPVPMPQSEKTPPQWNSLKDLFVTKMIEESRGQSLSGGGHWGSWEGNSLIGRGSL
ncbi:uncharacterized protein LOC126596480 [Malus sylvestris]|uniref:uncharacterized protein LOC126596480 n=1 Tax=Malus sylvestris TaxID=3752 RepID=UPI0021ACB2FB|nr:uncharacterized protein LOC126596480 [Malus sylvestris]